MVKHGAIQALRRCNQTAGGFDVGLARSRIAAWVVVRQDQAGTVALHYGCEYLPHGKRHAFRVALKLVETNAISSLIQVSNPKRFTVAVEPGQTVLK
jgi:hypothetical protein